MKAIVLQDIIIEGNDITIIKSGSTIIIDEGIKDVFINIKGKINKLLGDKSQAVIDSYIKKYINSLSKEDRKSFIDNVNIEHFPKTNDDNSYMTVIKGPTGFLEGLKHSINTAPQNFETTLSPKYNFDIDDVVELQKIDKKFEDTVKEVSELRINRITEDDYKRAMEKAKKYYDDKYSKVADVDTNGLKSSGRDTEETVDLSRKSETVELPR